MRPYFGHLYSQASAYIRQLSYADEMLEQNLITNYGHNEYNPIKFNTAINKFEKEMEKLEQRNAFAKWLRIAIEKDQFGPFIFQLFQTTWGLAIMDYIQYLGAPVVFDMDDNPFMVNYDNKLASSYKNPQSQIVRVAKDALECADGVLVSTPYLKKQLENYTYVNRMHVVPNSIDFDIYDNLKNNTHKTYIHIGWQGSSTHDGDLGLIVDAVKYIHNKYKNVRFTFVGDASAFKKTFSRCKRVAIDHRWVPITEFPKYIAKKGFDIVLAPMEDNQFNRCKSNLRLIQAGALKSATIASPTIPYKDFPATFASTTEDWIKAMENFIEDRSKIIQAGEEGYRYTKDNYSLERIARVYHRALKRIVRKHKQRRKNNEYGV